MNILFIDDDVDGNRLKLLKTLAGNRNIIHRTNPVFVTKQDLETADYIFLDNDMCLRRDSEFQPSTGYFFPDNDKIQQDSEICPSSGTHFCSCQDGYYFAKSLRDLSKDRPVRFSPTFVVHSMNPIQSRKICQTLAELGLDVYQVPFSEWNKRLKLS